MTRPSEASGRAATMTTNRLGGEASAYLRAHAHQAIAWRPWSREAFEDAARLNRPVLVSSGYLACYWCHVMAQESFSDPAIAAAMNRDFINIKIDREERPDIDRSILDAMARLGARTGWPVTAFLTPDGEVFAGGSYYPPEPRHGLPGFPQVLTEAAERFARGETSPAGTGAAQHARQAERPGSASAAADVELYAEHLARRLLDNVDTLYGGFGLNGPKFPQPALHELLWRIHAWSDKPAFGAAVLDSVSRICRSALFDHVGGGFHRYCVDAAWTEPHFEKMLYDNAQMVELMTWLWRGSGSDLLAERIEATIAWATRELLVPGVGFGSSLGAYATADAGHDVPGAGDPGTFYLWHPEEIARVLGDAAGPFQAHYDINPLPQARAGALSQHEGPQPGADVARHLADARARLLAHRNQRPPPLRDPKVVGDWNGLMVVALAEAGAAFDRQAWIDLAAGVFDSVVQHLADGPGLRHCVSVAADGPEGLLEDYASLSRAALRLYEMRGDARLLDLAKTWVGILDEQFWDAERGGYCASSAASWRPGQRLRSITETSLPSGNAMMIGVLARLHEITGEGRFRTRAEDLVAAFRGDIVRHGMAAATALNNVLTLNRFLRIDISGAPSDPDTQTLTRIADASCLPDRMVLRRNHDDGGGNPAVAQICVGTRCLLPLGDPAELKRLLLPGNLSRDT